jgi:alcohol dehydrogenase YqhD (iron-dependent ADH family)
VARHGGASAGRGLGASHAIGHTLGGSFGVPHGLTSCVALPAVLRWNEGVASDRQKLVAALMGNPELSASDAVRTLAHALDLPTDLAAIGIGPGQFRAIAEHTLHDRGIRRLERAGVLEFAAYAVFRWWMETGTAEAQAAVLKTSGRTRRKCASRPSTRRNSYGW